MKDGERAGDESIQQKRGGSKRKFMNAVKGDLLVMLPRKILMTEIIGGGDMLVMLLRKTLRPRSLGKEFDPL